MAKFALKFKDFSSYLFKYLSLSKKVKVFATVSAIFARKCKNTHSNAFYEAFSRLSFLNQQAGNYNSRCGSVQPDFLIYNIGVIFSYIIYVGF